ncbi:DUF4232 domain-containing protein [Streptomyces sp. NPDC046821]|uniref:DUF4232 domain-containing protein n=1 Tax=Streptomyces sp. NPDC046821 TaxID=3154702 RepID=UPI0033E26D3F
MFQPSKLPLLGKLTTIGAAVALATAGVAATAMATTGSTTTGATARTVQAQAASSVRTCAAGDLYASMGAKDFGAGQLYWPVKFTNTSTTACALRGYPGVSVLNTAHQQIGAAAARSGQTYNTVTIQPAHTATAVIHTTNGPIGGACRTTGTYVRVYPPASTHAMLVPAALRVCSNVFTIGPVTG